MAITLTNPDAFNALVRRIKGEAPVTATFRLIGEDTPGQRLCMTVEVDGERQDLELEFNQKGEWSAKLDREI